MSLASGSVIDWVPFIFPFLVLIMVGICWRCCVLSKRAFQKSEILERKIDELRIQTGIVTGMLAERSASINIPYSPRLQTEERAKPGPKPGSKRRKQLIQQAPETPV